MIDNAFVEKYCEEINTILTLAVKNRQRLLEDEHDLLFLINDTWAREEIYITKDNFVIKFKQTSEYDFYLNAKTLTNYLENDCESHKRLLEKLSYVSTTSVREFADKKCINESDLITVLDDIKKNKPHTKNFNRDYNDLYFKPQDSSNST